MSIGDAFDNRELGMYWIAVRGFNPPSDPQLSTGVGGSWHENPHLSLLSNLLVASAI